MIFLWYFILSCLSIPLGDAWWSQNDNAIRPTRCIMSAFNRDGTVRRSGKGYDSLSLTSHFNPKSFPLKQRQKHEILYTADMIGQCLSPAVAAARCNGRRRLFSILAPVLNTHTLHAQLMPGDLSNKYSITPRPYGRRHRRDRDIHFIIHGRWHSISQCPHRKSFEPWRFKNESRSQYFHATEASLHNATAAKAMPPRHDMLPPQALCFKAHGIFRVVC